MPLGHLMLGLIGGIAALVVALAEGQPLWVAALHYVAVGNLVMLASALLQLRADHRRRPPGRRTRRPHRVARLRPLRLPH